MEVKTITPREDLNHELNNMDEEQILQLLRFARQLIARSTVSQDNSHRSSMADESISGNGQDNESASVQILDYQICPLWYSPEEDAAWAHL